MKKRMTSADEPSIMLLIATPIPEALFEVRQNDTSFVFVIVTFFPSSLVYTVKKDGWKVISEQDCKDLYDTYAAEKAN